MIKIITYSQYRQALSSQIIKPRFKLYTLYPDFTIQDDLSDLMLQGGQLTISYAQGIRRTASVQIQNNSKFKLDPNGRLWLNTLFRIDLGLEINGEEIYFPNGVFVQKEPSLTSNFSESIFTLDLVDLFALFDGTVAGTLGTDYEVPSGSTVKSAIDGILNTVGITTTPIISNTYINQTLAGNVRHKAGDTMSQVLGDVVKFMSGLYYFDEMGRLCISEGQFDLLDSNKPSIWDFDTTKTNYGGCTVQYNRDKIYNMVVVDGNSLQNGDSGIAVRAIATNNDLTSPFCVVRLSPNPLSPYPVCKYISDNLISTTDQASARAEYELRYNSILNMGYQFNSSFMADLDVNTVVTITDPNLYFDHERCILTQIQIPFDLSGKISLTASNVNEVNYAIDTSSTDAF